MWEKNKLEERQYREKQKTTGIIGKVLLGADTEKMWKLQFKYVWYVSYTIGEVLWILCDKWQLYRLDKSKFQSS